MFLSDSFYRNVGALTNNRGSEVDHDYEQLMIFLLVFQDLVKTPIFSSEDEKFLRETLPLIYAAKAESDQKAVVQMLEQMAAANIKLAYVFLLAIYCEVGGVYQSDEKAAYVLEQYVQKFEIHHSIPFAALALQHISAHKESELKTPAEGMIRLIEDHCFGPNRLYDAVYLKKWKMIGFESLQDNETLYYTGFEMAEYYLLRGISLNTANGNLSEEDYTLLAGEKLESLWKTLGKAGYARASYRLVHHYLDCTSQINNLKKKGEVGQVTDQEDIKQLNREYVMLLNHYISQLRMNTSKISSATVYSKYLKVVFYLLGRFSMSGIGCKKDKSLAMHYLARSLQLKAEPSLNSDVQNRLLECSDAGSEGITLH